MHEIAEKYLQQQFEGNTTMRAAITLRESLLIKCQTITFFIINSSEGAAMTTLLLHQPLTIGVHSTCNKPQIWANHYRSWVSVTFLEAIGRLDHDVD